MALDGELAAALEEAAEQEKGLRQRGIKPTTAAAKTGMEMGIGGYGDGAG